MTSDEIKQCVSEWKQTEMADLSSEHLKGERMKLYHKYFSALLEHAEQTGGRSASGVFNQARLRDAITQAPRHEFWGAGDPDCPKDIKAANGELHTLRCKNCDDPKFPVCLPREN